MNRFVMIISGISMKVYHRYDYIRRLCKDYIVEESKGAAFSVEVSENDIEQEMEVTGGRFSREVCESTCIHREIVKELVKYGRILIHSAAIAVDGRAYVFLAKSGVGKSTHIRLWRECFGDRAVVVNGDKPLFLFEKDAEGRERLMVYGSPWRGKEGWGDNVSMPVAGLCLLERGETNQIERAAQGEVIGRLFHQVLLPKTQPELGMFMTFLNRMLKEVPFYRLSCNMEKEAALTAFEGMQGEEKR